MSREQTHKIPSKSKNKYAYQYFNFNCGFFPKNPQITNNFRNFLCMYVCSVIYK